MADLSPGLLGAVKGFEGWVPRATWDYKQHTNGWGTRAAYPGEVVGQDEAQRRLETELGKASGLVGAFAPNLDQGTHSALTSLTYNAGNGWMNSGLGKAVQAGDMDAIRTHLLQYNKAGGSTLPGLVQRRQAEAGWIGKPDALGGPAPPPYGPEGLNEAGPDGPQALSLLNIKQPDPQQPQMALGGAKPNGGQPMADGLLDNPRTQNGGGINPLVMMGLGMLTSAAAGGDYSKGMLGGAQAAQGFEQNRLSGLKSERDWQVENAKLPLQLQQAQQQLELGKLNIDQAKRQFVPNIGADAYGMPVPGFIDPVNMKVYGLNGQPLGPNGMGGLSQGGGIGAGGPSAVGTAQPDFSKTGPEFLATLPPPLAKEIQAYVEGRNVPSPAQMRGPVGEAKLRMIMQADPNYDYTAAPARAALRKSYEGGGKQYQELQAVSTVAGHLHDLQQTADKLKNFDGLSVLNYPLNKATQAYRASTQDPAVNDFNTTKAAVMNELAKAYRGGTVSDASVREFQEGLDSASTPSQMKAVIGRLNSLLMSKRQALEEGYKGVMGNVTLPANFSTVNDRTRKLFEGIDSWATGIKPKDEAAPQAAHPAAAAAVGDIVDGGLFGHPGERYKRTANGFERVK